jgi:hypothetical protein
LLSKAQTGAAIGTISAFSLVNYAYHYGILPEAIRRSALGYFLVVQLPFGIILPSALLGLGARKRGSNLTDIGVGLSARNVVGALVGLAAGGLMLLLAVGTRPFATQGIVRAGTLFAQLLVASTAEVLVFTGLLYGLVLEWSRGSGRWALPIAILTSSLGFGIFHFTYPPPWAAWSFALGLTVVWIAVDLVFVVTRTLLGAIVFNNCMALIGFLQNDLTLPIGVLLSLAMWFVAVGIALGLIVLLSGAP